MALAWDGDGKGFLHTLWPKNADGTYATAGILLWHHLLGTDPATDTYVFGRGPPVSCGVPGQVDDHHEVARRERWSSLRSVGYSLK